MKRRALVASMGFLGLHRRATANVSETILTINGLVERGDHPTEQSYVFTKKAFFALPQSTITTGTSWTPVSMFLGPTVVNVMREAGIAEGNLTFKALDNYSVPIPWSDIVRYGVILAHSKNGRLLSKRRWGPLWAIYPRDRFPDELVGPVANSRFIWQITEIRVVP